MVGSTFPHQIHSISVPVFENDTYRRGIELQLTEAVHKEIKLRTHIKLANESTAQTKLTGRIVRIQKRVLGETQFDDPRDLQYQLRVEFRWEDLQTGEILKQQTVPIENRWNSSANDADFASRAGSTLVRQQSNKQSNGVAAQIVDQLEVAW